MAIFAEADCLAPATWRGQFDTACYNGISGALCDGELPAHFRKHHEWCQQPGDNWLESYASLARVDAGGIAMLSNEDEIVTNAWSLGGRLVYSTFNAPLGEYELREVQDGGSVRLLSGIEVYELIVDPRDPSKWFLNGLRFADNAYIMGTFDPATFELSVETGITGQIETLVIIPD